MCSRIENLINSGPKILRSSFLHCSQPSTAVVVVGDQRPCSTNLAGTRLSFFQQTWVVCRRRHATRAREHNARGRCSQNFQIYPHMHGDTWFPFTVCCGSVSRCVSIWCMSASTLQTSDCMLTVLRLETTFLPTVKINCNWAAKRTCGFFSDHYRQHRPEHCRADKISRKMSSNRVECPVTAFKLSMSTTKFCR